MRIDSSLNFPQLPLRPKTSPAAQDAWQKGVEEARQEESRQRPPGGETLQVRGEARQQERAEFYSTQRDLPLRGQEALNSYLTTASFQHRAGSGELVGIDIYV